MSDSRKRKAGEQVASMQNSAAARLCSGYCYLKCTCWSPSPLSFKMGPFGNKAFVNVVSSDEGLLDGEGKTS